MAAKAASAAAYERVESLAAQLASLQAGSPLGLILRPSRVGRRLRTPFTSCLVQHLHAYQPGALVTCSWATFELKCKNRATMVF